jgi:hypothetical protein
MIAVFFNVEVAMLMVACACCCKTNSLNFIFFAPPLQLTTLEAFWNLNHHRSLVVVVLKFKI